jgi:hypothetical protein
MTLHFGWTRGANKVVFEDGIRTLVNIVIVDST